MKHAAMFLMLGVIAQIDPVATPMPTVTPLFMSRGVDAAPAFFIECRNTTKAPISSASKAWTLTRGAIRLDGKILDEQAFLGPGLTATIQPGGMWRGIIELRQFDIANSYAVALGAIVRWSTGVPLSAGRHTLAVRCSGIWSSDLPFYWEK